MKRIISKLAPILVICSLGLLMSCVEEEPIGNSELDLSSPELSELDVYIRENFVQEYNIEVLYNWNENIVTDLNRFLFPPTLEKVKPALEVIKKIWLESYSEVGGEDFVKLVAPRELVLVGSGNVNPSGTVTLGVAEGGKRITLFEVDLLNTKNAVSLNRFLFTIQHEYVHILNQTVPFDEQAYGLITPGSYSGSWFNTTPANALELGFITPYARSAVTEDFAEITRQMLTNSNEEYNAIVDGVVNEEAKANLRAKEALVVDYYDKKWNIDLYALQEITARKTQEILNR